MLQCCFRCTNHQQFSSYAEYGSILRGADDHAVHNMSGCLSSCKKSTYEIESSQQNAKIREDSAEDNLFILQANFPLSRYEVREQVNHAHKFD